MKPSGTFLTLLLCIFLPLAVKSQVYKTENGNVEFLSKAALNEFTGKSSQLQGLLDLEKNLLDFYLDLNTLKTGIGLRDRHMRDNYLETKKYPFAEFTGSILNLPSLVPGETKSVVAKGKIKIHGVERPIEVPGTLKMVSQSEILLETSFTLLLGDFKIAIPSVVFYELAEEQVLTLRASLKK